MNMAVYWELVIYKDELIGRGIVNTSDILNILKQLNYIFKNR